MTKKLKYVFLSSVLAVLLWVLLVVPNEVRGYILVLGVVCLITGYWLVMDLWYEKKWEKRILPIFVPLGYWLGYGLFTILLPDDWWLLVLLALFFGLINYLVMLVENIYMVAIGSVTVPLYRAAYTTSSILMTLWSFFLFNVMWSYRFPFWMNMLITLIISIFLFWYHFWSVAIQLKNDGDDRSKIVYIFFPSLVMAEMALIFSFWPVGIFKGSIYLVSVAYILSGLIEVDIRERLFRRNWVAAAYQVGAVLLAIFLATRWGV